MRDQRPQGLRLVMGHGVGLKLEDFRFKTLGVKFADSMHPGIHVTRILDEGVAPGITMWPFTPTVMTSATLNL